MKRLLSKLTYANVMATIAMFLVLAGGSAFAATKLAKNSVGTKQIKNNAITTAKIKNGSVTGSKINLSSLGTVPSATTASHATSADNATNAAHAGTATTANTATTATTAITATSAGNAETVNGQSQFKVFAIVPEGTATQQVIGTFAGLTLTSTCNNTPDIDLNSPAGLLVDMKAEGDGNTGPNVEWEEGEGPKTLTLDRNSTNNNARGETNFSAAFTNGTVVSGQLGYDDAESFKETPGCAIYGEVTVG